MTSAKEFYTEAKGRKRRQNKRKTNLGKESVPLTLVAGELAGAGGGEGPGVFGGLGSFYCGNVQQSPSEASFFCFCSH